MGQRPNPHPVCGCNCNGDSQDDSDPGFGSCCLRAFKGRRCPGPKSKMEGQCARRRWGISADTCSADELPSEPEEAGETASAVGDPHMTTNTGKHYDYQVKPQLLQHRADKVDDDTFEDMFAADVMGQRPNPHPVCGCNCNGDSQDDSDPGFGSCCFRAFKGRRCPGPKSKMEGQCAQRRWGISADTCSAEELPSEPEEAGETASAVGDPHMTTNSGKHYDYKVKPQ